MSSTITLNILNIFQATEMKIWQHWLRMFISVCGLVKYGKGHLNYIDLCLCDYF